MDNILLPNEIDIYIDALKPQNIKNIGNYQWLEWHQRLQKLNQEALIEASTVKEEHVKESLVSFGKVNILIHEAILINIWKYKIFPHLMAIEPNPESTFIAYSIFYHEAVCVALLELVLYHPNCCEALKDSTIDLLDYLSGTTSQLLSISKEESSNTESAEKELLRQRNNLTFDIGIRSLSILRYLADCMERLPLNIYSCMYSTYDIPVLFIEILIAAPWVKNGQQYVAGSWKTWDNEQLCQSEAQIWLTLRQLLLDPECPKYYAITESRRCQLMKLLPLMKPTTLDQLSPLIELKQWLCRLSVIDQQPSTSIKPVLLEAVLEIKEKILQQAGGRWRKIAEKQLPYIFMNDKSTLQDIAKKLSEAYNTDLLEKFEVKEQQTTCVQCGKRALQRCSNCKKSWYCSRSCQVIHWSQHKNDCIE